MPVQTNHGRVIENFPKECPYCHNLIKPVFLSSHEVNPHSMEAIMICPNDDCARAFIAYYDIYPNNQKHSSFTGETSIGTLVSKSFSESIKAISPQFVIIYNQAYASEQQKLFEICGVGYRKALEFLIKDYTISKNEESKDKIEKALLAEVIKKYVGDSKIKSVATRAVWLGNDETHYLRKWEGKDLQDLKRLIDLTVHWIEMETLTSEFEKEMPEK
jgi:hypothetical protein